MVPLRRLVEVTPGVWVATSRRCATTSTVILDGRGGALVIDPAWDADELAAIPADLAALGVRCVAGLATHQHYDHVLWHPDLGEAPRWASAGTARDVTQGGAQVVAPLRGDLPDDLLEFVIEDAVRLTPVESGTLEWTGPTAVVHVHHAHAPHHLALELPDLGVLVAGDMLSDVELPMPDERDDDLVTYLTGLDALAEPVRRARLVVPGHGNVGTDPVRRWDADRCYLDALVRHGASDDARIVLPGMPELHTANQRRAAATPAP